MQQSFIKEGMLRNLNRNCPPVYVIYEKSEEGGKKYVKAEILKAHSISRKHI